MAKALAKAGNGQSSEYNMEKCAQSCNYMMLTRQWHSPVRYITSRDGGGAAKTHNKYIKTVQPMVDVLARKHPKMQNINPMVLNCHCFELYDEVL